MALKITENSGNQTSTGSPQSATAPLGNATQASNVQHGTAGDLLKSQSGVPLSGQPLTTVSLAQPVSGASSAEATSTKSSHHFNGLLLILPLLLVVIAAASVLTIRRTVKNTTHF